MMTPTTYHPGGHDATRAPGFGRAIVLDVAAGTCTMWDEGGSLVASRPLTEDELAATAAVAAVEARGENRRTLEERLSAWLETNTAFLGWDQARQETGMRQQVVRLTRQSNALIRLALTRLDSVSDA